MAESTPRDVAEIEHYFKYLNEWFSLAVCKKLNVHILVRWIVLFRTDLLKKNKNQFLYVVSITVLGHIYASAYV